jgi:hypothetical protein
MTPDVSMFCSIEVWHGLKEQAAISLKLPLAVGLKNELQSIAE